MLLKDYLKENDEDSEKQDGLLSSPLTTLHPEQLRKKERKAQKKATKSAVKLDVIRQSDLARLEFIIYPPEDSTRNADEELANALAVKFLPNFFAEKRHLDTLMAPPKERSDFGVEADRVVTALEIKKPKSKIARSLLDKIRTAIKEDIDKQWNTDLEMKKRRIIYAQWITQGAVEKMAEHYDDWDLNIGARTNRRYKGDELNSKSKNGKKIIEDDLGDYIDGAISDLADISRRTSLTSIMETETPIRRTSLPLSTRNKTSPLNDTRRGGNLLHPSTQLQHTPAERPQAWGDENCAGTPETTRPTLRILALPTYDKVSPWATLAKSNPLDLSVKPPSTVSPSQKSLTFTDLHINSPSSAVSSPWMGPKLKSVWSSRSTAPVVQSPHEHGPVADMLTSTPSKMASTLRVIPKKVPVDGPVLDDDGEWATVGTKGKVKLGAGGRKKTFKTCNTEYY
jgi:hypothetical protein